MLGGTLEERKYSSYSVLTLALDGVSSQYHASDTPGTHWIGGWMDTITGLDTRVRRNSFTPTWDQTLVIQYVVRHYTD